MRVAGGYGRSIFTCFAAERLRIDPMRLIASAVTRGSAAERTYKKETFYREVGLASRAVAALYNVPWETLERCRDGFEATYFWHVAAGNREEFARWYDYEAVVRARHNRSPNIMISTIGFYPGGAEIFHPDRQ